MHLPRTALLAVTAVLTGLAYYLVLFTNWGNYYRGATYLSAVGTQAELVLAVFSCVEVLRTDRVVAVRALAGALGVPLFLVTLLLFWYGVRKYVAA
jgi:hypothetical protein